MENFINDLASFVWTWNVPILVGSGVFFLVYSKLTPFKYLKHAFEFELREIFFEKWAQRWTQTKVGRIPFFILLAMEQRFYEEM